PAGRLRGGERQLHERVGGQRVLPLRRRQGEQRVRGERARPGEPPGHELGHDPDRRPTAQRPLSRQRPSLRPTHTVHAASATPTHAAPRTRRIIPACFSGSTGSCPSSARTSRCARPNEKYVATLISTKVSESFPTSGHTSRPTPLPSIAFMSVSPDAPEMTSTPSAPTESTL